MDMGATSISYKNTAAANRTEDENRNLVSFSFQVQFYSYFYLAQ